MDFETCTFNVFLEEKHDKLQLFYDGKISVYEMMTSLDTEGVDNEFIIIEMSDSNFVLCERARVHGLPLWKRIPENNYNHLWESRAIIEVEYPETADFFRELEAIMDYLNELKTRPLDINYLMAELLCSAPVHELSTDNYKKLVGTVFLTESARSEPAIPFKDSMGWILQAANSAAVK